jgi:hypothetical protein
VTGEADAMLAAFARWSADQRWGEAVSARSRERWLRQQEAEAATLSGTLVDLAEQGAEVTLVLGGRRLAGRLVGVGPDLCVLEDDRGSSSLVSLWRLGAVLPAGGLEGREGAGLPAGGLGGRVGTVVPAGGLGGRPVAAGGDRDPALQLRFADALAALAAETLPVRLLLDGGDVLAGDLVGVGADVVTLRLPLPLRGHAWAAIWAIDACKPV